MPMSSWHNRWIFRSECFGERLGRIKIPTQPAYRPVYLREASDTLLNTQERYTDKMRMNTVMLTLV